MLEELIEEYIKAKAKYDLLRDGETHTKYYDYDLAITATVLHNAESKLLGFIKAHSDTLIGWERQNALRLSPFEDR